MRACVWGLSREMSGLLGGYVAFKGGREGSTVEDAIPSVLLVIILLVVLKD